MNNPNIETFINFLQSHESYSNLFIQNMLKSNYDNEDYWSDILSVMIFSDVKVEKFVLDNFSLFNTKYLIIYGNLLSTKIIDELIENEIFHSDSVNELLINQHLTNEQIQKYIETVGINNTNWELLQEYQNLTENFINKYEHNLDWDLISENQFMELKFLIKNINKINWSLIAKNYKMQKIMNESFIKLFINTNIWDNVGWIENIDFKTIFIYRDKLNIKSYISILENKDLTDDERETVEILTT
jgi:hypothetical protein